MILIPNVLTLGNLLGGVLAIVFSLHDRSTAACWLVLMSAVLDGLDGWTARLLKKETSFGAIFDSFSDFVSFGLAPAFIFYAQSPVHNVWVLAAATVWIGASCFRLIRFHVLGTVPGSNVRFQGLPTTAGASIFAAAALISKSIPWPKPLFFVLLWLLSWLMASRISFGKKNNGLVRGGRFVRAVRNYFFF